MRAPDDVDDLRGPRRGLLAPGRGALDGQSAPRDPVSALIADGALLALVDALDASLPAQGPSWLLFGVADAVSAGYSNPGVEGALLIPLAHGHGHPWDSLRGWVAQDWVDGLLLVTDGTPRHDVGRSLRVYTMVLSDGRATIRIRDHVSDVVDPAVHPAHGRVPLLLRRMLGMALTLRVPVETTALAFFARLGAGLLDSGGGAPISSCDPVTIALVADIADTEHALDVATEQFGASGSRAKVHDVNARIALLAHPQVSQGVNWWDAAWWGNEACVARLLATLPPQAVMHARLLRGGEQPARLTVRTVTRRARLWRAPLWAGCHDWTDLLE